jgi:NAD(P)-dependent dehydrogenase (short-subunit alcohol dehydrogenase family)
MASSSGDKTAVWFITGCSTGIGRALAERVLERGYRCVVTARSLAQVEPIAAAHPQRALALALDVTDPAQREAAVAEAEAHFGGIDVLVNNAGSGYNVAVEEANEDAVRAMFEVNFFGLAAMMRRVLPGMRARGSGHIINVSSVGGLIGNPGSAFYCATKFAVEGLSQGLAKEAASLGIRVTLIEPGPFRTDFQGRSMRLPEQTLDAYAQTAGARRAQLRASDGQQPGDPVRAADAIVDVFESPNPPVQLLLGKSALERLREARAEQARSIGEWEKVTLATDFPAH